MRMAAQSSAVSFILMNVQVIDFHVYLALGVGSHDLIHEVQEVYGGAPVTDMSHHLAGGNFQSSKQGLGSVPNIFIRPTLGLLRTKRQQRLRSIQGLNAGLLVHTENQRILRRIQIQANNVQQLGFEFWIRTAGES